MAGEEKESRIRSAGERLEEAVELPEEVWRRARTLARQLSGAPILPLVGAGASVDCDRDLGSGLAQRLYDWYREKKTAPPPRDLEKNSNDLGLVADALYAVGDQAEIIEALRLRDRKEWPEAGELPVHFCAYRLLARLVREGLFSEAITLNYDCCFERGLEDEGFQFSPWKMYGKTWLDHATVVGDGSRHVQLDPRGEMVLTKAHGCSVTYRRKVREASTLTTEQRRALVRRAEEEIVIRRGQLLDWRTDLWARDLFADRARRHVVLLLGVSAQDPVIQIALTRVLEEVYGHLKPLSGGPCLGPRVVAVDTHPDTVAITGLIHQGCGRRPPGSGVVTSLEVPAGASMTAVVAALAVEMLALKLQRDENVPLPSPPRRGVVDLLVAAPASLRWTYMLERRRGGAGLAQRANLERAGENGYVPLRADPARVAESLRVRQGLRAALGFGPTETVKDALRDFGFVVSARRGRAFMPVGMEPAELRSVSAFELQAAAKRLSAPAGLDPVLVAGTGARTVGRAVATGKEVTVL